MYDRSKIEDAIRFAANCLSSKKDLGKPVLAHSVRVGMDLWAQNYDQDIVIAGILHDVIEDSEATLYDLTETFGERVANAVANCSKNEEIEDKNKRREEVIQRACSTPDSMAVKAADILDNFRYYTELNDRNGIEYC